MNTTLSAQVRAIQIARDFIKRETIDGINSDGVPIDSALNDAASTIAALNITKDLPKDVFFNEQELRDIKMACDILGLMVKPKNEEQEKFFARCGEISNRLPHITYP